MKRILKKFITILLILILLNNFFFNNYTYAAGVGEILGDMAIEAVQDVLGTVVGILAILPKIVVLAVSAAVNGLTSAVAYSANDGFVLPAISPFDIIFNRVALVDINFFNIKDDGSLVMSMRTGVANWYYIMRIIAAAILLVILIYVGIRMLFSTVASDKALYKKMLVDWVASLALIFLLQYIIIFTINVNNAFVEALKGFIDKNNTISTGVEHVYLTILSLSLGLDIESLAATAIYAILVWQTLGLFISYFKRMLKLAFLIIIAPLITLTYSIDKMGDGKAQALGNWLKEFVFTVLLQPFHCIIYMTMVNIAFSFLIKEGEDPNLLKEALALFDQDNNILSYAIISILCILFVKEAEKIIRKIFQFADDGSTGIDKGLIAATAALKFSGKAGVTTAKGINKAKNFVATNPERMRNIKADAMVAASFLGKGKDKEGGKGNKLTGTVAERKEKALTQLEEHEAEKMFRKLDRNTKKQLGKYGINTEGKYKVKEGEKDNAELAKMAEAIREADPSISSKRAMARARLQVATNARKKEKAEKSARKHPKITKARSTLRKLNSLDTVKDLKNFARTQVNIGIGAAMALGGAGTGQGFAQSIMLGASGYNMASEINKNTSKSLAQSASKNFEALNCKDSNDIQKVLNNVLMNQDAYKDNSDEVRQLLDNLKSALKELGASDIDSASKNIHSKLKHAVATGNTNDVENILNMELGKQGLTANSNVLNATKGLNSFENEKAILSNYTAAQSAGIGSQVYVNQASDALDIELLLKEKETESTQSGEQASTQGTSEGKDPAKESEDKIKQEIEDIKKKDDKEVEAVLSDEQKNLEEEFIKELEKEKEKLEAEIKLHEGYGYTVDDKEVHRLEQAIQEHQKAIDEFERAKDEANLISEDGKKMYWKDNLGKSELSEQEIKRFISLYITQETRVVSPKMSQTIQSDIISSGQQLKNANSRLSKQMPETQRKNLTAIYNKINN